MRQVRSPGMLGLRMSEQTQVQSERKVIKVQLPDGAVREVPSRTTPLEIANTISPRLAAAVVVAQVRPLRVPEAAAA